MTNRRPYKEPQTEEWALEELDRFAGAQFDPELVRLFIDTIRADWARAHALRRAA